MRNVYLASSWRNEYQEKFIAALREQFAGRAEFYDFKNPKPGDSGFSWREIDLDWTEWSTKQFYEALGHPTADKGFDLDFDAMREADGCILLLPCGRSAHLEAGYFVGASKGLFICTPEGSYQEPELMYKMATGLSIGITALFSQVEDWLVSLDERDEEFRRLGTPF